MRHSVEGFAEVHHMYIILIPLRYANGELLDEVEDLCDTRPQGSKPMLACLEDVLSFKVIHYLLSDDVLLELAED